MYWTFLIWLIYLCSLYCAFSLVQPTRKKCQIKITTLFSAFMPTFCSHFEHYVLWWQILFGSHMKCLSNAFILSIPVSGEKILPLFVVSHSRHHSWRLIVWFTTLHQNNSLLHYVWFYVETWTECVKSRERSSRFSSSDFNKCSIKVIDGRKYHLQVVFFLKIFLKVFFLK